MFDFTLAKFMQVRLPVRVFLEIFSDVLREQNVSGIAAVHDPLCDVDAGASHVRFSGCVDDSADWSAVYAHSQLKFRMFLERAAYFQRAFNRCFRAKWEEWGQSSLLTLVVGEEMRELGERSCNRTLERFSADRILPQYEALYRRVIAGVT